MWRAGRFPPVVAQADTRLFRAFVRAHKIEIETEGEFTCLRLDGVPYVWPATAEVEPLKHLLAELVCKDHPHQYDYGLTRLGRHEVLLDIGCCEGGFAVKAAEKGAEVIAIEPSPIMGRVIRRLFDLRGLPAPLIKQCLLGPAASDCHFQENARDPAQSRIAETPFSDSHSVQVLTLDELTADLPRKPTFIKCDAEGADFGILQGGREFLGKFRPKVAVTTYHHADDFARISAYLRSLGYKVEAKGLIYVWGALRVVMVHAA